MNPFSSQRSIANLAPSSSRIQHGFPSQPRSVSGLPFPSATQRRVVSQPIPRARPVTPPRGHLNNAESVAVDSDTEMDCLGGSAATAIVIPDTPSPRKPQSVARANSPPRPYYACPEPEPEPSLTVHTASQPQEAPEPQPAVIELSEEQQKILDKVKDGKSLFFTGSAGEFPASVIHCTHPRCFGLTIMGALRSATLATRLFPNTLDSTPLSVDVPSHCVGLTPQFIIPAILNRYGKVCAFTSYNRCTAGQAW